ncbi:MAG: ATP-binding cassette domain-containing protein [Myxococcales bacterium]|nr:ATP-binding cassette domain-containing protein [Myxococcales bacterium]
MNYLSRTRVQLRSALNGRARWRISELVGQEHLARTLETDLLARPEVREAAASPLTGGVLLHFDRGISANEALQWVLGALERKVHRRDARGRARPRAGTQRARSKESTSLRRILETTHGHPKKRRKMIGLSLLNGLEDAVPPLLIGLAADTVARGPASWLATLGFRTLKARFLMLGGLSVGFWAMAAGIEYLKERAAADLANAVRHDLRVRLYERIQTLDVSTVESRDVAEWMAILEQDVDQVHNFIHRGVEPFFNMATNLGIVGTSFIVISPGLAAAQLVLLPPIVAASMLLLKPIRERHMIARDDEERLNVLLSGNLRGAATIASFNREEAEIERVREASHAHLQSVGAAERLEAVYVPTLRSVAGMGLVTTLLWGGLKVSQGSFSVGGLNILTLTLLRLLSALARMGVGLDQFQKTATASERLFATLDARHRIEGGSHPLPPERVQGDIRFENVTFGYDASRRVLDALTMHCPAGRTTGLVGASGAGKSTVLKLLLRFYEPDGGAITLDGRDIRELHLGGLRTSMATVFQEVTLFGGTVRDNIEYGGRHGTIDAVKAAQVAEAHDFVKSLPGSYEANLGFGGLSLSGGQRQRIAIARAVMADRPILLFDEATSALDHTTEEALQRSLETVTRGRTTLIVAHRLSTIRHADVIHVLDQGRVRESGSHDELIRMDGLYARMWNVQTGHRRSNGRSHQGEAPSAQGGGS